MGERDTPVVLAVDDDEMILETYEMWLGDTYELRTATSGETALELLDDDVQVVLLDRLMPGLSGDEVLERIDGRDVDPLVAMVTAVEPDVDIAEMPFDAYVTKALDRATVRETVERLVNRAAYDDVLREHYAVAEKLSTIEGQLSEHEQQSDETYTALVERFESLDAELDERASTLDRETLVSSFEGVESVTGDSTETEDTSR